MRLKNILLVCVYLFVSQMLSAQEKGTFRGYVNAGFTINQISGDSLGGFNYWGITGGGGTYFMVTDKISTNLEINYSMRGASGTVYNDLNQPSYLRAITTNYIEVPVMVNYHDKDLARFGVGLVASTLLQSRQWYNETQARDSRVVNYYKSLDIAAVGSVTFDFLDHYGVSLRMLHSILPTNNDIGEEDQHHISLSGRFLYYF